MSKKLIFFLLFVFVLSSNAVIAQSSKAVTGVVVDPGGSPLPGVNVLEKGTTNGTTTDFNGNYSINVGASSILVFSYLGFTAQEISLNGKSTINVTLQESFEALDEVVITALGIRKEKKALSYAVQEIDSETITIGANPNINTALQGKVAGVNITSTGGVGGNARIDIRGASSLTGNDNVLWVIDGVPFSAQDTASDPEDLFGGISNGGGLLDINPDDIESMSVLKGGPAAALYGSRGANGVILITTKSGKNSKGLGISYNGTTTFSEAAYLLDLQNQYGQGINGVFDPTSRASWGPRFDGVERVAWTGEPLPYEAAPNLIEDFTRVGVSTRNALAFSKGSEAGNFRVSVAKDKTEGIFDDQNVERLNYDLRASYDINKWLNVDAKISYINTRGAQRPTIGTYSFVSYFNSTPANIRAQDLSPGFVFRDNKTTEILYGPSADLTENPNANARNPYFLQRQTFNSDERNRVFGYLATTFKFTENLTLKLKYGLDFYRYEAIEGLRFEDQIFTANSPTINSNESFFKEENSEFLLNYNKDLNEDFTLGLSAGGNLMKRGLESLEARSGKLTSENDIFLNAGQARQVQENFSRREIHSVYGFLDTSYKDYLFLNVTARNDWSSALPSNNNSYFYSSAGLSALISEMVEMPDWVNYLKVRATWAEVGKDTDPFQTNPVFTLTQGAFNLVGTNTPDDLVNRDLVPEISTTTELGLEFKLFNNRFGLDVTLYNESTENQIIPVGINQSSGFNNRVDNLGLITNKGVEIIANVVPIKTEDFTLGLTLNFARNEGIIEEFVADEPDRFHQFFVSNTIIEEVRGIPGEKLGDIFGFAYQRDANGNTIVGADGLPVTTSEKVKLGNIQADFTGSIGVNTRYKNFSLNALFIMQQGGDIYSLTEAGATGSGNTPKTLSLGREPFFVPKGVLADGSTNTTIVSPQAYWQSVSNITEEFIYDASFMKLGEISIGYTFPKSILKKIGNGFINDFKLSLVGRNLFYLYRNTPGTVPDAGVYNTSIGAQAFDFSPVPVERTYGFSLNIKL